MSDGVHSQGRDKRPKAPRETVEYCGVCFKRFQAVDAAAQNQEHQSTTGACPGPRSYK